MQKPSTCLSPCAEATAMWGFLHLPAKRYLFHTCSYTIFLERGVWETKRPYCTWGFMTRLSHLNHILLLCFWVTDLVHTMALTGPATPLRASAHSVWSVLDWWTWRLFPGFYYYKQGCDKHLGYRNSSYMSLIFFPKINSPKGIIIMIKSLLSLNLWK